MPKPEWVRVRYENGTEGTTTRVKAEAAGLKPLDKPAVGRDGRPLPPKHRVALGVKSAKKSTSTKRRTASTESQED